MKETNIYILSCVENGGIYRYSFSDGGALNFVDKVTLDRPMYSIIENNKFYTILREPFFEDTNSGLIVFDLDNGKLKNPTKIISTKGEVACHLCADNGLIYVVNYTSGSIIRMPDKLVKHIGSSINKNRQATPHAHYVGLTPDNKYICAVDLGLDKIILYDKNLNFISNVSVKPGNGARHLIFSDNGKYAYCANELSSTVTVFSYNSGNLCFENEYTTFPEEFSENNAPAAIRFHKGYIYVSNRGHNSIACYKTVENTLELIDFTNCGGCSPRDFNIYDDFLVCTNEESDNVVIFKILNGILVKINQISVPKPLCVCYDYNDLRM